MGKNEKCPKCGNVHEGLEEALQTQQLADAILNLAKAADHEETMIGGIMAALARLGIELNMAPDEVMATTIEVMSLFSGIPAVTLGAAAMRHIIFGSLAQSQEQKL